MRRANKAILTSFLGVFCVFVVNAPADWPVFRGNALQTGVAETTLPDKLEILWRFPAKDAIEGSAAIADGTVYFGDQDGNVFALNLADGKQKWTYKAGAPIKVGAAVNGNSVYIGDEDGKFHCLDIKNGQKRWIFDTQADITSAPNFDGNKVLFGGGDEMLYCLDKDKGPAKDKKGDDKPLWSFKVPGGPVLGSPAVINNRTFVAGCDSALHVIDTTNGKEIQEVQLNGQVGATPALAGDFLYIGTMSNDVEAINWKDGKIVWTYQPQKRPQPFFASVAITPTLVLAGSRDKCLHAIDRQSGKMKWVFTTGGKVDSSPVVAGKRVYFGSNDSKLYVVDLESGKEVQSIVLGKKGVTASAAVSGERLVIGTIDGDLICLGKKK
ncbi:MAG TPA: PQQ-binding-like beta-propeller repeat protein [Gemmataceae bacterium]|nr:PQQ-binding-like beta-propeller repeat protein [Gemmataceae bacterium]